MFNPFWVVNPLMSLLMMFAPQQVEQMQASGYQYQTCMAYNNAGGLSPANGCTVRATANKGR